MKFVYYLNHLTNHHICRNIFRKFKSTTQLALLTASPSKTFYTYTGSLQKKIIHRNWKFTHKKHIRRKLIMASTSSKLKYSVQKTTIQRHWAQDMLFRFHEQSTALLKVPSILCSCYSNYELKRRSRIRKTTTGKSGRSSSRTLWQCI